MISKIFIWVVIWRFLLFIAAAISLAYLPIGDSRFLGGGEDLYLQVPLIQGWANFDGNNYVSIARDGYTVGKHSFFPFFPLLISVLARALGVSAVVSYTLLGLAISHFSLLLALVGLYKLLSLDYKKRVVETTILLILTFPMAFYFGTVYTESLFLCLVVWFFYFLRKNKWLPVLILGALASSTRIIGSIVAVVSFVKAGHGSEHKRAIYYLYSIFTVTGIFAYMYYLYLRQGDPLAFYTEVSTFGEQRSAGVILLPQVFYRYIVKILPSLDLSNLPFTYIVWQEFLVGIIFLLLSIISVKKLDLKYSLFLILGYLIPTFSGSFSSLPRYVIVLFPAFLLIALFLERANKTVRLLYYFSSMLLLIINISLFFRGYWVA